MSVDREPIWPIEKAANYEAYWEEMAREPRPLADGIGALILEAVGEVKFRHECLEAAARLIRDLKAMAAYPRYFSNYLSVTEKAELREIAKVFGRANELVPRAMPLIDSKDGARLAVHLERIATAALCELEKPAKKAR